MHIHLRMDIRRNHTMDIMDIHLIVLIHLIILPILLRMDMDTLMGDILNMLHHHRINPIHILPTDLRLDPVNHLLLTLLLEDMEMLAVVIEAHHYHIK